MFNQFWFISDAGYGLGSDFQDDNFARRKQRRNRTTFTLQQVNVCNIYIYIRVYSFLYLNIYSYQNIHLKKYHFIIVRRIRKGLCADSLS